MLELKDMEIETINKAIDNFLERLEPIISARVLRIIDLLSDYNYKLGLPYSKSLHDGLFELRIIGKKQVRIIYCFHNNKIYLLHSFFKKQNKILKKDIDLALKRKNLPI
jgi:phage-related protein